MDKYKVTYIILSFVFGIIPLLIIIPTFKKSIIGGMIYATVAIPLAYYLSTHFIYHAINRCQKNNERIFSIRRRKDDGSRIGFFNYEESIPKK